MKTKEALLALGHVDKVAEMFLMGNSQDVSRFIRSLLMQAQFYGIDAKSLGNFLAKEVEWQDSVYKNYKMHLSSHSLGATPELVIEKMFD